MGTVLRTNTLPRPGSGYVPHSAGDAPGGPKRSFELPLELRYAMKTASAKLAGAENALRKCERRLEDTELERAHRFSDDAMRAEASGAADGLNFSSLDELRSLKLAPPPLVQVVCRCVGTLICGEPVGNDDAKDVAARLRMTTAGGETAATRRRQKPRSAEGSLKPWAPQRESTRGGRLLTWKETQALLARSDFKNRLYNFDGRILLDNEDLIAAVRARVDLGSIDPNWSVSKAASSQRRYEPDADVSRVVELARRARRQRELDSAASVRMGLEPQTDEEYVGVVKYAEACYVNQIAGAMLIWISRVFEQHTDLQHTWEEATGAIRAAAARVHNARQIVDAKKDALDSLLQEAAGLRTQQVARIKAPKPTQLTRPDDVGEFELIDAGTPNLFFQNARIAGMAPRPADLPARLQLPAEIYFYVRLKFVRVPFPFPNNIPTSQFLHCARVVPGHEAAGPACHIPFDAKHVIGLAEHNLLTFCQLVIEVPSTATVNPHIRQTRLSFHPRHDASLHASPELPRIIIPVYPHGVTRGDERAASAPPRSLDLESARGDLSHRGGSSLLGMRGGRPAPPPPPTPPANVPRLAIAAPGAQVGSPFRSSRGDEGSARSEYPRVSVTMTPRAAEQGLAAPMDTSRMSHGGDTSRSRGGSASSRRLERSGSRSARRFSSEADRSARTAAIRVAATKAEGAIGPLVERVEEGYLLTIDEMRKLKACAEALEERRLLTGADSGKGSAVALPSARGSSPPSARGSSPPSARGLSPQSARGAGPSSARGNGPSSARGGGPQSARAAPHGSQPARSRPEGRHQTPLLAPRGVVPSLGAPRGGDDDEPLQAPRGEPPPRGGMYPLHAPRGGGGGGDGGGSGGNGPRGVPPLIVPRPEPRAEGEASCRGGDASYRLGEPSHRGGESSQRGDASARRQQESARHRERMESVRNLDSSRGNSARGDGARYGGSSARGRSSSAEPRLRGQNRFEAEHSSRQAAEPTGNGLYGEGDNAFGSGGYASARSGSRDAHHGSRDGARSGGCMSARSAYTKGAQSERAHAERADEHTQSMLQRANGRSDSWHEGVDDQAEVASYGGLTARSSGRAASEKAAKASEAKEKRRAYLEARYLEGTLCSPGAGALLPNGRYSKQLRGSSPPRRSWPSDLAGGGADAPVGVPALRIPPEGAS